MAELSDNEPPAGTPHPRPAAPLSPERRPEPGRENDRAAPRTRDGRRVP
ncbi:hypothetical protein STXM2123_402 [Streptomyces sp. F-3]|nr:hypothetical protein STXM2123_402 [Streptomyces sp. F-3]